MSNDNYYGKTERFMKSLTNKSKLKRAINTMPRNILQMLDELKRGDIYMKMKWNPR